jgi:hypothetical protein
MLVTPLARTSPVPQSTVTLSWATFLDAANEAGQSREYGGIHFVATDGPERRQAGLYQSPDVLQRHGKLLAL